MLGFAQRSCFRLASTARVHGSNFQDHLGEINQVQRLTGAPEEIRTPDPQIRSLVLYPAELRARLAHRAGKRSQNEQSRRECASSYRLQPALASSPGAGAAIAAAQTAITPVAKIRDYIATTPIDYRLCL